MIDYQPGRDFALELDKNDPLANYRDKFHIPPTKTGDACIYLCGNSLGLQPKSTKAALEQELLDWQNLGVEGHFHAKNPWLPYHEFLAEMNARLVGAKPTEVVAMNTLTVNLNLLMVSFYRPTKKRYKILIEANPFPSDRYAIANQIRFHGHAPETALLELPLRDGEDTHRPEDILAFIEQHGDDIALILLGGVNYYTGQLFDIQAITEAGHKKGCVVGFDLAHAAGNVPLNLHDWDADFACWCTYKYLNAGPGSVAGAFVHERHAENFDLPRFSGWWGHNKETRFKMGPTFEPIAGAEGWQMSNPPILSLAAVKASMEIFDDVGMAALREKSLKLTGYMEYLLNNSGCDFSFITPADPAQRGAQLSIRVHGNGKAVFNILQESGVICDWREPDCIRVAPAPLYNSYADVFRFVEIFTQAMQQPQARSA